LQRGDRDQARAADRAPQFPAAQLGDALGRAVPGPARGRGDRLPQEAGREVPGRLHLGLPGGEAWARAGRAVGEAIDFLKTQAEKFPEGFTYDFQGESRQFVQEGNSLVYTFVFALVVIFLVLAAQYESFRDPFIILIALPTSIFGALIPLNAGLGTINIYTQIGLVTLIGLIAKHGILMVDFANKLQEEKGYIRREAIEEAAALRLRPILMTTAATVVAMIPLLGPGGAGCGRPRPPRV